MAPAGYQFGAFRFDRVAYRLSRDSETVDLTPKLLDLLLYLLERPAALVTKEELLDALWPGANVTENALAHRAIDCAPRAVVWQHSIPLLLFLGVVASIGATLAVRGLALVRLVLWIAAAVPLLAWVSSHGQAVSLPTGLVAVSAVYVITLLSQLYVIVGKDRLIGFDTALLHLNPAASSSGCPPSR